MGMHLGLELASFRKQAHAVDDKDSWCTCAIYPEHLQPLQAAEVYEGLVCTMVAPNLQTTERPYVRQLHPLSGAEPAPGHQ